MSQAQLDREVAQLTGESVGFHSFDGLQSHEPAGTAETQEIWETSSSASRASERRHSVGPDGSQGSVTHCYPGNSGAVRIPCSCKLALSRP